MPDLEQWLVAAVGEDVAGGAAAGEEAVALLLDLAREAAHNVARPAAPLATFAAGFALGRDGGGDLEALRAEVARIVALARTWLPPGEREDG